MLDLQKRVGTQVVTEEGRAELIRMYNAYAEEFNLLGIGKAPLIDEYAEITIEELFFFQGVMASKLMQHIENTKEGRE